jgi:hypothetical protein
MTTRPLASPPSRTDAAPARRSAPAVAPRIVHEVLAAPGQPLDAAVRARMEPRFRHSFADVRVHTNGPAAESARAVGARAYAVGRDVVFGAARYAPGSAEGDRLIAHELAHVVQQRGAASAIQPKLEIGAAEDPAEREADAAAGAVVRGGAAPALAARAGTALRRDPDEDGRALPNPAREERRRGPEDPIDLDENTPYVFFRFGEGGRLELIFRAPGLPVGAMGLGVRYERRRGLAPIASADPLELEDTYSPRDARGLLSGMGERPEVEGAGPGAPRIPLPGDDDLVMRVVTERMGRALRAILEHQRREARFQLRPPFSETPGLPPRPRLGLDLPPLRLGLPPGFEPALAPVLPPPRLRLRLRTPGWGEEEPPAGRREGPEAPPTVLPRRRPSLGGGYNVFRSAAGPAPAVAPPIVHDVLRSSGAPLDPAVRARMEPRLGHSFADVRVHTGARAAESARAVGAHAYAAGAHVVFGAGRYAPGSADGERLIAHELAHVVQQRGAAASIQPSLEIGPADDPAEREAERAADGVVALSPAPVRVARAAGRTTEDMHRGIRERWRAERHIPPGGRYGGGRAGPSDSELTHGGRVMGLPCPGPKAPLNELLCVQYRADGPTCLLTEEHWALLGPARTDASTRLARARQVLAGPGGATRGVAAAARTFTGPTPTAEVLTRTLDQMAALLAGVDIVGASCDAPDCQTASALGYVDRGSAGPVYLCPRVWLPSEHPKLSRTILHEVGHLVGIDAARPGGENYCSDDTCGTRCDDAGVVDAWAKYIYCLGEPPPAAAPPAKGGP